MTEIVFFVRRERTKRHDATGAAPAFCMVRLVRVGVVRARKRACMVRLARVGVVRARLAGTPSLASYCFPALRAGRSRGFMRLTAGKQTMPGSVRQPATLARTTPTRLWQCERWQEDGRE
jgi:hypothetical protein